jgi:hypothetical protein
MPLRDHFHPPVSKKHRWDAVHGQWPGEIVRTLFGILPEGFQAEPKVHLGSPIEIDVGTYHDESQPPASDGDPGSGGVAVVSAPAPTITIEADLSEQDQYEVLVYDVEYGRDLVAAIEIVSPSNKDRPDRRDQFVAKVESLLQQGVCVSIVDLVGVPQANLYSTVLGHLGHTDPKLGATSPTLYAASLRARKRPRRRSLLDAWYYPMVVGEQLPTLPVWLRPDLRVLLPLEPSYEETCRLLRIA